MEASGEMDIAVASYGVGALVEINGRQISSD